MADRSQWVEWLIQRFTLSRDDAEDLVQESLIECVETYRRDHPNASDAEQEAYLRRLPEAFVHRLLYWRFCNWCRAQAREHQALEHWAACFMREEDAEQSVMQYLECERALSQMPDTAREVVRLWLEGYSWQEISARLGISVSAAKMRFQRGVEAVRVVWGIRCDDRAVCGVNLSGECEKEASPQETQMEAYEDETTQSDGHRRDGVVDSESYGACVHPQRNPERRGGETSRDEVCGCTYRAERPLSEEEVKAILRRASVGWLRGQTGCTCCDYGESEHTAKTNIQATLLNASNVSGLAVMRQFAMGAGRTVKTAGETASNMGKTSVRVAGSQSHCH